MKSDLLTDGEFKEWFKTLKDECECNYEGFSIGMEVKIWLHSVEE